MWDPYAEFETVTLPNGLKICASHWPGKDWEAIGFVVHCGVEQDPVDLVGLSHFVEHMVASNADTEKNRIRNFVKSIGGDLMLGSTGYQSTCYSLFIPIDKAYVKRSLAMFGNMLLFLKLKKFLERETKVIIGEFDGTFSDQVDIELIMRQKRALYSGSRLASSISASGMPEIIGRITQDDVQSHYDLFYTPHNITIVAIGGLTVEVLLDLIKASPFARNKIGDHTIKTQPLSCINPPHQTRHEYSDSQIHGGSVSTSIGGYDSYANMPGTINPQTIYMYREILESLLFEEVRQRRSWTYDIHVDCQDFGFLRTLVIKCPALALSALDHIDEVIEWCICESTSNRKLFEQHRRESIMGTTMIDASGSEILENSLKDITGHNRIISMREIRNNFEKTTFEDIQNLAQYLVPEMRYTRVVRP